VSLKVDQGSCGSREIEVLIRNGEIPDGAAAWQENQGDELPIQSA
jgi:hypothetical protein